MKNIILTFVMAAAVSIVSLPAAFAGSTFGSSDNLSWSGNAGWLNWEANGADGAVIGEFVCSGYIYGANIGWIHLGNGIPGTHPTIPNAAYYSNASADDYGLNVLDSADLLKAGLRGLAYGANIGWIAFEDQGNPQVDLVSGAITGYAWGANIGWINLGELGLALRTERLDPGIDTDGDGIPDSWELLHAGDLTTMDETTDSSGNGMLDINAYRAGLDPFDPNSRFAITDFSWVAPNVDLTWTTVPTRLYRIQAREDLTAGSWATVLDDIIPAGATTSATLADPATDRHFYRVEVYRPLVP